MKHWKLLTVIGLIALAVTAFAADVAVAWDPVDDAAVKGYRIYRAVTIVSNSLPPDPPVWTNRTLLADLPGRMSTNFVIKGLASGVHRFGVTAYIDGEESNLSEIVTAKVTRPTAPANFRVIEVIVR